MTRHPTTVPMHCPTCGATVCLPVTCTLTTGGRSWALIDPMSMEALNDHMVVCAAERILEDAE